MCRCGHIKEALEATEYAEEKTLGLEDIQVLSKIVLLYYHGSSKTIEGNAYVRISIVETKSMLSNKLDGVGPVLYI